MKAIKTRLDNLQKRLNSTQCDFAVAFVENGIYTHQEKTYTAEEWEQFCKLNNFHSIVCIYDDI